MKKCPVCNIDEEPLYPPTKWGNGKYILSHRCTKCGHMSQEEKPRFITEPSVDYRNNLIYYIRDNEVGGFTHMATPNAPDVFMDKELAEEMAKEWNEDDAKD